MAAGLEKIAIVGAGHNGLTCAAYLSRAGFDVSVFEKREITGGLCVTESPFTRAPGIKVSSVASYFGMLRREVIEELDLEKFGLKPYLTDPIEIILMAGGQYVYTPREECGSDFKVDSVGEAEMEGWRCFWQEIQRAAAIVYPFYLKPGLTQERLIELLRADGLTTIADHIFDGSLFQLLSKYVESDGLKAVAATCTPGFAGQPGSVFGCIHHGTASTCGEAGAWGQVQGGMGKITEALARASVNNGAKFYTGAAVRTVSVEGGRACGLEFEDGRKQAFDAVICALDPYVLFESLLSGIDGQALTKVKDHLNRFRPRISAAKLHFLLRALPGFKTLTAINHNHKGVIVIAPDKQSVEGAAMVVPQGKMPDQLMLTMAFPTLEDPSMSSDANDKHHVLTVDVHYLPAQIEGRPWTEQDDRGLEQAVVRTIESQCPGFRELIVESYVVSPRLLAERYNLRSLSCWHLPMTPEHLFENRSLPGCEHYHTPVEHLYVCSAGTYPGGNVTAAPGHNLAKLLIERYKRQTKVGAMQAVSAANAKDG
jgi:phytoene dehydrogenase-like protein